MVSNNFYKILEEHIPEGSKVAELFHGAKDDILVSLVKTVGFDGVVYGIDKGNPFPKQGNMRKLTKLRNIILVPAVVPPMPVKDLDAIVIRDFLYTYPQPFSFEESPEMYKAFDESLNPRGMLILNLSQLEQEHFAGPGQMFDMTIHRHLGYERIFSNKDGLVYRKS